MPYIIAGNYEYLYTTLLSQLAPLTANERTQYIGTIDKDIPRTVCFLTQSKKNIEEKMSDTSAEYLSYLQGNLTGALFSALHPSYAYPLHKELTYNWYKYTDFVYIDDNDNLCGFSVAYLTDSQKNVSDWLNICIVKNPVASPREREVTFIVNDTLLEKPATFNIISKEKIHDLVQEKINSNLVFIALKPLFHFDHHSLLFRIELYELLNLKMNYSYTPANFAQINLLLQTGFLDCLYQLNQKIANLYARGFHDEAKTLTSLVTQLKQHKNSFILGTMDKNTFKEQCLLSLNDMPPNKLHSHRHWLGKLINKVLLVLNLISGGYIPLQSTDTMKKINKTQHTLFKMPEDIQKSTESDNISSEKSPPI